MAKKMKPSDPGRDRALDPGRVPAESSAGALGWWLVVGLLAVTFLGIGWGWYSRRQASWRAWPIPAIPVLSAKQSEFHQRLVEANARASSGNVSREGVVELGRLYHATGFTREAEVCWRILLAAQPAEARWPYYLSDLRRMAADGEGLKTWLEQTVKLAPDYAPAWLELAELEFKTGHLDEAERDYRRRIGLVPDDPYAGLGLARVRLQRGQRDAGRKEIEELVRRVPDFSSAHNVYAELLAQEGEIQRSANERWFGTVAGRFRPAEDPWKEELRVWCYDPDQLMVWGAIERQTKRGDRGKSFFERAISLAPDNPRGFENLGLLYLDAGETAKARELLEQGAGLPQASELLFVALSDACRTLHQPAEALHVAERGLTLMPDSADLANARGLALDEAGRPQEAMEAYRVAAARAPSSPEPAANMGISLLRLGRKDEAYACLKQAVELQPMFSKALTLLARLDLDAGRLKSAAQSIFPYFEQYPGLPTARDLMGKYYLRSAMDSVQRGDVAGAEEACRKGLTIVPEAAELHGFLGVQYLQQRRLPEALEALETSRHLQPADPRVLLYLGQVYAEIGRISDARLSLKEAETQARQRGDAALAAQCAELVRQLPE